MALQESPRENLLHEATALVERIELARNIASAIDHVVVGFRTDGAMSIFIGDDPVYQFNSEGHLRRAYCDAELYKAIRGRLVSLRRVRQRHAVELFRHDLTDHQQKQFLSQMRERLREFVLQLDAGQFSIVGQVPADAEVLGRVRKWFTDHDSIVVADLPHVRGRTAKGGG